MPIISGIDLYPPLPYSEAALWSDFLSSLRHRFQADARMTCLPDGGLAFRSYADEEPTEHVLPADGTKFRRFGGYRWLSSTPYLTRKGLVIAEPEPADTDDGHGLYGLFSSSASNRRYDAERRLSDARYQARNAVVGAVWDGIEAQLQKTFGEARVHVWDDNGRQEFAAYDMNNENRPRLHIGHAGGISGDGAGSGGGGGGGGGGCSSSHPEGGADEDSDNDASSSLSSGDESDESAAEALAWRLSRPPKGGRHCEFFLTSSCRFGARCRFQHALDIPPADSEEMELVTVMAATVRPMAVAAAEAELPAAVRPAPVMPPPAVPPPALAAALLAAAPAAPEGAPDPATLVTSTPTATTAMPPPAPLLVAAGSASASAPAPAEPSSEIIAAGPPPCTCACVCGARAAVGALTDADAQGALVGAASQAAPRAKRARAGSEEETSEELQGEK